LGSVAHGKNKLNTDEEDTGVPEDEEDVFGNVVAKGVEFWISETSSNEVEGEVEVGLFGN